MRTSHKLLLFGGRQPGIIRSIFADGTDGFYFDFSKTDRLFQAATGPTAVSAAGQNIGLALESSQWSGRTYAQVMDAAANIGGSGYTMSVGGGTGTATENPTGQLNLTGDGTNAAVGDKSVATTAGVLYELRFDVAANALAASVGTSQGGQQLLANNTYNVGPNLRYFVATGATSWVRFLKVFNALAQITNISIRPVAGNHGLQATTSAQPKYQTGGLARFDGLDDCLVSSLQLGVAGTMMLKFNKAVGNSSQAIMGQRVGSGDDAIIILNTAGLLLGNFGTGANLTGAVNRAGANVVAALTWDGATVNLYENGVNIGTQAQSGTLAAANVILGSALTTSLFAEVDVYHALAIKKALTAAEIAAITSLWGTS